ncbi:hypothetical protein SSOG_04177 [Streptomyces himastatinicus ATCC 53653]|uniref:Putative restriction endonuclease domain-containing protein n=1 Tax=Streptomyces himastatinicus ATCC 53653 TaxID=457427 RepID=D9WVV4_9ACTN|nr:hypothetical protein SSOG_04177 [Streptomyces himastatinicus ATCC 53653]
MPRTAVTWSPTRTSTRAVPWSSGVPSPSAGTSVSVHLIERPGDRPSVAGPLASVCVAPGDAEEFLTEDGLGFVASAVRLVVEVVSPGHENQQRDRARKRRAYAGAGIPVYVLIDDHDQRGTVTLLTSPSPDEQTYAAETRVPYGTEVEIPEGPAKGFAITEEITGPRQG